MNTPQATLCPHCKKPNSNLESESGDPSDLPGSVWVCDHCGKQFEVKKVQMVAVLTVVPYFPRTR